MSGISQWALSSLEQKLKATELELRKEKKRSELLRNLKLPCGCTDEQCSHCFEYETEIEAEVEKVV